MSVLLLDYGLMSLPIGVHTKASPQLHTILHSDVLSLLGEMGKKSPAVFLKAELPMEETQASGQFQPNACNFVSQNLKYKF